MAKSPERRWIILADNGCHVTVSRSGPPTEAEMNDAAKQIEGTGLRGWHALMDGRYHRSEPVVLTLIGEVGTPGRPRGTFEKACELFQAARARMLS